MPSIMLVITLIMLIMLPFVAAIYYSVKKNKNINYKGKFLELSVTLNNRNEG